MGSVLSHVTGPNSRCTRNRVVTPTGITCLDDVPQQFGSCGSQREHPQPRKNPLQLIALILLNGQAAGLQHKHDDALHSAHDADDVLKQRDEGRVVVTDTHGHHAVAQLQQGLHHAGRSMLDTHKNTNTHVNIRRQVQSKGKRGEDKNRKQIAHATRVTSHDIEQPHKELWMR